MLAHGEAIAWYPEDRPYPSKLVLGWKSNRPLHILVAENADTTELIVITCYEPRSRPVAGRLQAETVTMLCPICRHGATKAGHSTATLERGSVTLVVRRVPAEVCDNCGEEYVGEHEANQLLQLLDQAEAGGVRVDVRDFLAA